jgi:hypothetical protein
MLQAAQAAARQPNNLFLPGDNCCVAVLTVKDHPRDFEQFVAVLSGPENAQLTDMTVPESVEVPGGGVAGGDHSTGNHGKIICRIEEGTHAGKLLYIEISNPQQQIAQPAQAPSTRASSPGGDEAAGSM